MELLRRPNFSVDVFNSLLSSSVFIFKIVDTKCIKVDRQIITVRLCLNVECSAAVPQPLSLNPLSNFSLPVSSLLGTKVLRRPIHSLEINTARNFDFSGRTFLVTGSEDTKVKIFDAGAPTFCRFQNVATLTTHISSVKCVDVVVDDDFALVVSAGGRAQVRRLAT